MIKDITTKIYHKMWHNTLFVYVMGGIVKRVKIYGFKSVKEIISFIFSNKLKVLSGNIDCSFEGSRLVHNNISLIYGLNNRISIKQSSIVDSIIEIRGNNNTISIQEGCILRNAYIRISEDNNSIAIGENFDSGDRLRIQCYEGHSVKIGKDCMFSTDVEIKTGDGHSIFDSCGKRINTAADVIINEHVWIGKKATILKGAIIGKGSVIGYSTICTKGQYDDNSVYVGCPAKKVRSDINWIKERV